MAGTVQHARLESPSARARLKRGRQPHWQALVDGKVHLGWQCWKGDPEGRWILRRYVGLGKSKNSKAVAKYRTETLGRADDSKAADGIRVLNYEQAKAAAEAKVTTPGGDKIERLTVAKAMELYIDFKRNEGLSVHGIKDLNSRINTRILPELADLVVSEIETKRLRNWLASMAASPAQTRPKDGKPQYRSAPVSDEDVRRRCASANRVLSILKAALNHAFDEGHVNNRDAWGRRLKPFRKVDAARPGFFKLDEARRLINASSPEFRSLLRAALETGCRYSELARMKIADFNITIERKDDTEVEVGRIAIPISKSGKTRDVTLTYAGLAFFREYCAGRTGLMFTHANGKPWQKSEQARPMREACKHARISPAIGFHQLRHTWASHAVMNGMPLMVVAMNLGHRDTRMVEKHYGHLAPSFITEAIRVHAPVYGITELEKVVPLRGGG